MKQNTCFVWKTTSSSDLTLLLFTYDWYKNKIHINNKFFSILLVRLATQSVNHTSLKNLEILFKKRCFHISQHFTELYPNTPLYPFKIISVLYFPKSASGLPSPNSLWEGEVGFSMLWPAGRSHRDIFTSLNFKPIEKFTESYQLFCRFKKAFYIEHQLYAPVPGMFNTL